ncbi:MAG: AAA family ATPase [Candidatus Aenigmarchaeota archaeon]|nr:AAA family ATPase [Candidatus Aenigmarchaeota archaeon]
MKKIIGIVGMPGSGKTEALHLFKSHGFPVFNMGDVVTRIEPAKRGIRELNEFVEQQIRTDLRRQYGKDAIAMLTSQEVEKIDADVVVVAGIHSFPEIAYFKKKFGSDFVLIALEADGETRFKRLDSRKVRPLTREEFEHREINDRYDIPEIVQQADYTVENEGTLREFQKALEQLISVIHP